MARMSLPSNDAYSPAGLHNTMGQADSDMQRTEGKSSHPRQSQMIRSPRSMLSTNLLSTVARMFGRNTKFDGTDIVQKTIRLSLPRRCQLVSFDATGPPDGKKMY